VAGRRGTHLLSVSQVIRQAIGLLNAVADGADDEEITPSMIAGVIRDAREASGLESLPGRDRVQKFLGEALDAVEDGMPADYVALHLYAALGAVEESSPAG
jgi:hypothetical protein